jgi:hypothetical protein
MRLHIISNFKIRDRVDLSSSGGHGLTGVMSLAFLWYRGQH